MHARLMAPGRMAAVPFRSRTRMEDWEYWEGKAACRPIMHLPFSLLDGCDHH